MNPILTLPKRSDWIYERSEAGIAISGDSGYGKSVLMRQIVRSVVKEKTGAVFLFDPHGDLADELLVDCLEMGPRVRDRLYYFEPGNIKTPIGCLNPLAVQHDADCEFSYKQELDSRVRYAAHLLLEIWGEKNFDGKTQLFTWTTLILRSLAQLGLTIPDARYFLEVGSELYHQLVEHLPDPHAQWKFRELASQDVGRQSELLGSTQSRFYGLNDQVLQTHLGGKPESALNIRRLIEERAIVLVSFRPHGQLHEDHVSILANYWLSEVFFTIFNTPQDKRLPTFVCCDELPTFRASAPLLARVLKEIRKMKTRFIGAFQGIDSFQPLGMDDPLLKSMDQCGTTFVFHHRSVANAMHFGQMASIATNDPKEVKLEYWEPQQYQDGWEERTLTDTSISEGTNEGETSTISEGRNWSTAVGETKTEGENYSGTEGESTGTHERTGTTRSRTRPPYGDSDLRQIQETLGESDSGGRSSTKSRTITEGRNASTAQTANYSQGGDIGKSLAQSKSRSIAITTHQKTQLVPILKWRDVLKFIEFYTGEEKDRRAASEITRLDRGEAFMINARGEVQRVVIPRARPAYHGYSAFRKIMEDLFRESLQKRTGSQTLSALMEYRKRSFLDLANLVLTRQRAEVESSERPRISYQGDEELTI